MQTFRITPAVHKTARKLVDDDDLVIRNYIVVIALKYMVRFKRLLDMVVKIGVGRIAEIFYTEKSLRLFRSLFGYLHGFFLNVHGKIVVFFQRFDESVHVYVKLRRLFARS